MNIFEADKTYIANTYKRFPINIVRGKGSLAYDSEGREYTDLGAGIAVNIFGYCDDDWMRAVSEQMNKFQHTSNLYYTEPCIQLAKLLCTKTGLKKVFFSNSGAEANECAIKAARKYASDKKGPDTYKIITLKNSFHGRTLTTLAATGQDSFHECFLPLTDGFLYSEPEIESITKLISENKIAAVMFETIRGEGGVLPLEQNFVTQLVEIAHENDILIIDDEVQTGNGRCGALYNYMNYGFMPDIVTTAKGIGGGLPIGVTMLGEKTADVFTPGLNGSTFGGNPMACAGAVSIISRLDKELMKSVREKSKYIFDTMKNADGVLSVTGGGLMIGIETKKPALTVAAECMNNGVLVLTAKDKIRLLPALNIPKETLEKAIAILQNACKE